MKKVTAIIGSPRKRATYQWNDTIEMHTLDKNRVKEMLRKWQTNTQRNSNEKH